MFSQQELQQLKVLVQRSNITGQEATAVAILLQKISGLISKEPAEQETKKENKKPEKK